MDIEQCKKTYEMLKKGKQFIANIDKDFFLSFAETVLSELEKKDKEIKELKENIDYQVLYDFLISSVSNEEPPIWTEKHIEELLENFEMRWKNAYK